MPFSYASLRLRAVLTAALVACAACTQDRDTPAAPRAAAAAEFVGGTVCAGCHADEARAWAGSHHDLAMQPATPDTVLGDFDDASFDYAGLTSRFFRGDGFRVTTDGPDGTLQDFAITHTFGVEPLQQYLAELPGGRRQALAIAWDARPAAIGGQRWFHLYPDDAVTAGDSDDAVASGDRLHWTGTALNWNTSCAACHSTGLRKAYDAERQAFATTWSSVDVDCEACHGPGSLHAAAPRDASMVLERAARAWILAPGAAIAARAPAAHDDTELSVCAQCHSRRAQIHDAFAAGEPLLDNFIPALLEDDLYHADGQILGEVFEYGSFVQSAMYAAGVTCSDCHDPHTAGLRADGNALCAGCHAASVFDTPQHHRHADGDPGSACVDCHMRAETYMVVDPRRDHGFKVPRPDLSASLGTPNACNDCHADESPQWAAARVADWFPQGRGGTFHFAEAIHAGRAWTAERAALLARTAGDRDLPGIVRATAVQLMARHSDAASVGVVEDALQDGDERVQLAALESLDAVPVPLRAELAQRFLTHPRRALRTAAAVALVPARDSLSERRREDLARALDEYVAVQTFNGDRAEGPFNHANLLAASGSLDAAEAKLDEAIEREPAFSPAYANLADLYRRLGREADAAETLRRGLSVQPDDAALHYALGLSLVRSGRGDDALTRLARAAALAPGEPRYAYAHGIALSSSGRIDDALDVLTAAARRFPGYPPTLFALAALHRDRGDVARALDYVGRLLEVSPSDPDGRALRAQLEAAASTAR